MTEVDHNYPALPQKSDANAMALALLRIALWFFFVIFGQYKFFGTGFVRSGFRAPSSLKTIEICDHISRRRR